MRDGRRRQALLDRESGGALGAARTSAAAGDEADAERLAIVRQLVARMPHELAAASVYHAIDEMTHDEIAEVLGCSRRHVGDLLARARAWAAAEVGGAGPARREVGR